jgi:hypothetical protein
MRNKRLTPKKTTICSVVIIVIVVTAYFATITAINDSPDYRPDDLAREDRRGAMYGYVFLPWENLLASGVAGEYMDLIEQCLDFAYVHAQWSVIGKDNNTLNTNYLGNLTQFIKGLSDRGVQVVIHIWVSSYSPKWMQSYTPELVGQKDRWQGIDPKSTDNATIEHRNSLKWSMEHFMELLCQYFIDQGVKDDIIGFCLDDETQSDYWLDFFESISDVVHGFNASWETMAMFNRYDKYYMTGAAGMDVNAMDPYDQDERLIQKVNYAYQHSGVKKISVLLDAMGDHNDTVFHTKMRRQAWISWFLGADSIGWYTFLYGNDKWACARNRWAEGKGPIITAKTRATINAALDIRALNEAYGKIQTSNITADKTEWTNKLLKAYDYAKSNEFTKAEILVQEVLEA